MPPSLTCTHLFQIFVLCLRLASLPCEFLAKLPIARLSNSTSRVSVLLQGAPSQLLSLAHARAGTPAPGSCCSRMEPQGRSPLEKPAFWTSLELSSVPFRQTQGYGCLGRWGLALVLPAMASAIGSTGHKVGTEVDIEFLSSLLSFRKVRSLISTFPFSQKM